MLTNTREQPSGPPVCLDTHEVARPRPGLLVGNVPVSPTSPAGVTTARVWVLAWVSTPMTKSKLSATIAMRHRPPSSRFGVVTASAREEAVVGRNCKGSPPGGYRAGHASDQATATRPGPAPVPTTSTCGHIPTKDTSCPRVSQFSGHAHPRSRDQHRSCQPAPGQPPPTLTVSVHSASTRGATEADRGWRHLRLRFVRLDCVLGVAEPRQREQLPTGLIYLDKFRGARSRPCLRAAHDSSSVSIPTTSERPDNADTNGVNGPLPTSWRSTSTTASGRRGSSTENSCTAKPLPVHSAITRRSTPAPSRYRTRTATRPVPRRRRSAAARDSRVHRQRLCSA